MQIKKEETKIKNGVLIAFGELYLKSKPVRELFIRRLGFNIQFFLKKENLNFKYHNLRDRIFVETSDIKKAKNILKNVFGISWIASVYIIESNDLETISNFVIENQDKLIDHDETYAIILKHDKGIIKKTREQIIGEIAPKIKRKVDLTNPKTELNVEIKRGGCYIYTKKEKGAGGLPLGTSGKSLIMMSGGIDSPVSAYFSAKRGSQNIWIHFHSFPIASRTSIEKVEELAQIFLKYQGKLKVIFVPFGNCQMQIKNNAPPQHRVILYRRLMLKVAEKIAQKNDCRAIFTGESLGQVSSQTLANMEIVEEAVATPILRPVIGFDKEEIVAIAKNIGTLDVSNKPHEDCCTLFVSTHQSAQAKLKNILEIENALPIKKMIEECLKGVEIKEF